MGKLKPNAIPTIFNYDTTQEKCHGTFHLSSYFVWLKPNEMTESSSYVYDDPPAEVSRLDHNYANPVLPAND